MNHKKENSKEKEPQVIMPYGCYMPCHPPEEDEIDLRELWSILVRRKGAIFATIGASILLMLMYIWGAKPIYEAKALMQIGRIGSKPVEAASNLKVGMEKIYGINDKNIKKKYPYISAISIPRKTDGLIQLTAQGLGNKSVKGLIKDVCKNIASKHEKILLSYIDLKKHYLLTKKNEVEQLRTQIDQLSKNLKNQDDILKKAAQERNFQGIAVLTDAYSNKLQKLTALQDTLSKAINVINEIELSLSPINIKKTQLVGKITTYDHPVKPRKKLMIILSLVMGLVLGVFIAFFLEFVNKRDA